MRIGWSTGLALAALAATPALADEWARKYTVKQRADVRVLTDDGSVRVSTGSANEVDVRVTTVGWEIAAGEVTVTERQAGDQVSLEVRLPKSRSWSLTGNRRIEVDVKMPAKGDLDVRTGDGSVTATGLAGRISLSTGDGSIGADALQGELRLHTGDGSIRGSGLSGHLSADTGDGSMNVRGRFEGLDLRTGDGSIDASVEAGSKLAAPWSVSTGDGGVTLRIPPGLGAELEARTGDGSIVLDSPVSVRGTVSRRSVRGQIGGGGPSLRVRTGDGSIRLTGL
jgi:DUF4097 and DUF4098 domain-containing protein YvlB